ncbi:MAG: SRPBCC family protein [Pseudomonadota bacterium]
MKIKKTTVIHATPDQVWEILGPKYAHAGDWASSVYASGPRLDAPVLANAPVAGRVCQTSLGPFTETIEAYDAQRRHVSYSAAGEKMPGFVKRLTNSWTVRAKGGASEVEMELNAKIAFPFNLLMGPLMRLQFARVLRDATQELKHYAETGTPHPRKVKVNGSQRAIEARAALA